MPLKLNNRNRPLLHDPEIVNRVQKFLEHDKDIEFGQIVRQLQAKYPEYRRRKQGPFRQLVKQALRIVNKELEPSNSAEEISASDDDVEEANINTPRKVNVMSSLLNNIYNKVRIPKQTSARTAGDAISISSDESQENQSDYRKTFNSSSRSSINSQSFDVELSPISEMPSISQSNAGQKRTENSISDASPAKKMMSDHKQSTDEMQHQDEYISDSSENVSNKIDDIPKKKPRDQHKTKEKPIKSFKKTIKLEKSVLNFHHLGGIDMLLKKLCQILIQIKRPEIYHTLGVVPPKGILIYGTSGCGKTCLAYAIAGQLNIPIINIPATELIAGVTGESEERIRDIFEQATAAAPCVLFIDDIEAISSNRIHAQKEMERRIVSQLINCIDNLNLSQNNSNVLIIGATTRPDSLDSALRRAGRFDHEISLPIPNRKERQEILRLMCNGLQIEPDINYDMIAELTPGYVGADISALVSRASLFAVKRKFLEQFYVIEEHPPETNANSEDCNDHSGSNENTNSSSSCRISPVRPINPMVINIDDELEEQDNKDESKPFDDNVSNIESNTPTSRHNWNPTLNQMIDWLKNPIEKKNLDKLFVTFEDFKAATKVLQPSAKREGFLTVPDVSWNDIGSLRDIREELRLAILAPVKFSKEMIRLGLTSPSGVLLCGPPGCGKTLIAKAIANEAGINFLSVKGPELMNMYVGESERAVRDCFQRARNSAPCVIFFDEFDSLCPKRSDAHEGSSGIRVVNQLLTEMDGIEERKGVYVMAASNRPDIIDPAILRPGRLDTILYVGLPNVEDRIDILRAATKNRTSPVLSEDVNFTELAEKTEGYTGADLSGMIRKGAMLSLKDVIKNQSEMESPHNVAVCMKHLTEALQLVRPSISAQDRKIYEIMREKYAAPRYAA